MSKKSRKLRANLDQGRSANEQTGEPALAPIDVAHSRKQYVGWRDTELGYNVRQEPRMSDPAHQAVNLQQGQFEHALWRPRGMPGIQDYPDGGSGGPPQGKIKAVHHHDYGLGPLVRRPADLGHDPIEDSADADYLHNPTGPRPDVLDKYVGASALLPQPTGPGSGFPLEHTASQFETMGDDIGATLFDRNLGQL